MNTRIFVKTWQCFNGQKKCDMIFTVEKALHEHAETHKRKCVSCKLTSDSTNEFYSHVCEMTCPKCGKKQNNQQKLAEHYDEVHDQSCKYCEKSFMNIEEAENHVEQEHMLISRQMIVKRLS